MRLTKAATALINELNETEGIGKMRGVAQKHKAKELGAGASRLVFQVGKLAVKVMHGGQRHYGDQNAIEAERWAFLSKVKGMDTLFAPVVARKGKCVVMPVAKTDIENLENKARWFELGLEKLAKKLDKKNPVLATILWDTVSDLHNGNVGVLEVRGVQKMVCLDYGFGG